MASSGLTQLDLAAKSGVGQSHIGRLLNETSAPITEFLGRMAKALGVPASFMLRGTAAETSQPTHKAAEAKRIAKLNAADAT